MDEQKKAQTIEVTGTLRDDALKRFQKQIQQWQLAMPSAEPLVLDFGLGRFHEVGLIEYWIANEIEAGYCGKFLFVFDGQRCPMHQHQEKHETFFIVKGQVKMTFNGQDRIMSPGDTLPVSTENPHSFIGQGNALILEVSKPCMIDDNYFANTNIPIGLNYKKGIQS